MVSPFGKSIFIWYLGEWVTTTSDKHSSYRRTLNSTGSDNLPNKIQMNFTLSTLVVSRTLLPVVVQ